VEFHTHKEQYWLPLTDWLNSVSEWVILRPTVSRPVYLGIKHPSGAFDQIFFLLLLMSDDCGFVDVWRSLWREDGSVVYNFSLPLPVEIFSGPTPMGLVTIIYCLRFETSFFVASYDSQGYGGRIRPRLHTGLSERVSELYYDRRSVGQSVFVSRPHLGLMTRFFLLSDHCGFFIWGALSDERTGLSFTMYNVQHTIHFTVSDLRPGPCIYIPQEQGGPVIPPGTGSWVVWIQD
jgi:hypothetical protein